MTNPGNAIGTNAAYGGRTSVNAFNDGLAGYSRGVLSGWGCTPDSGLTVALGGDGNNRDVAIAEDNAGNKTTINNISGSPVSVTIAGAPASNSRIDAIVAYIDNPANGDSTTADNPGACGIIPVSGTASASPVAPTESAIRTAITADGASGTTAYYVVLATVTISAGTTDLTSSNITAGTSAGLGTAQIQDEAVTADKIDFASLTRYRYDVSNIAIPTSSMNVATYTIPSDGTYFICLTCSLELVSSQHTTYITLYRNDTLVDNHYCGIAPNYWGQLAYSNMLENYAQGDTVRVSIRDTVGIPANVNTHLRLQIIQLSANGE